MKYSPKLSQITQVAQTCILSWVYRLTEFRIHQVKEFLAGFCTLFAVFFGSRKVWSCDTSHWKINFTPLHKAAICGHLILCQLSLSFASLNLPGSFCQSPEVDCKLIIKQVFVISVWKVLPKINWCQIEHSHLLNIGNLLCLWRGNFCQNIWRRKIQLI